MLLLCNYYITYRCNAYCNFCHFGDHSKFKNTPFADLDIFKKNVSELSQIGVKFIDLTGGEPLLHKDVDKMALFAKSLKMQTSITTNCLLYPKYAERLAGNVNLLHFSLDSPVEDEHNAIRNIACYKKVFESIEIAKSLNEYPDILFTVTNETYKKLPEMHDIAIKQDLVLLVNPVFSYFNNPGLNDEALDYIEEYCEGKPNIYLNKAFIRIRKNGGNNTEKPSCKAVSRVIVISPNNEIVLPCYHLGNKLLPIDKPIKELREEETINYYRQNEGKFDFCSGCTINCYFEPSFAFPLNYLSVLSMSSKFRYGYHKLIKQNIKKILFRKTINHNEV
ncbi:MAG: radical SAM protein [Bacteroidota bacterium]|nr:radical SAM protein [Bacteroidota bacterium]